MESERIVRMPRKLNEHKETVAKLREFFERNGYLRSPDRARRKKESATYKKGYEMRFPARDARELREIRMLLRRVGVNVGRSFEKHRWIVQPVYGKKSVQELCERLGIEAA